MKNKNVLSILGIVLATAGGVISPSLYRASTHRGRETIDASGPDCNPAAKESGSCCSASGEWRCKDAIPEGARP